MVKLVSVLTVTEVFTLLIIFQLKHLLADYYLQVPYMYENKGKPTGWLIPLASHAGVHTLFTALIAMLYFIVTSTPIEEGATTVLLVAVVDGATHLVIDRWKATQPYGPDTAKFWTNLGIDQMLHHLVGIGIIYLLITT